MPERFRSRPAHRPLRSRVRVRASRMAKPGRKARPTRRAPRRSPAGPYRRRHLDCTGIHATRVPIDFLACTAVTSMSVQPDTFQLYMCPVCPHPYVSGRAPSVEAFERQRTHSKGDAGRCASTRILGASTHADNEAARDTLSFAAGATGKTIEVASIDDHEHEESETLTLTLSNRPRRADRGWPGDRKDYQHRRDPGGVARALRLQADPGFDRPGSPRGRIRVRSSGVRIGAA